MATPNIVPRADSEGGIGTASKYWASAYIDLIYVGAGKMGRDADNLIDFSSDNQFTFRVGGNNELIIDASQIYPATNDGMALGYPTVGFSDLFLASGAVINFNNGNVTLTHSNNKLILGDSDQLGIGNDADLVMYHDTQDSYITNDTGNLEIKNNANDGDIIFKSDDGSGGTTPYFYLDGSSKEIRVNEEMQFEDNVKLNIGTGEDLTFKHDGTNSNITNSTGNLTILNNTNDGDIIFKCDDGSGGVTEYFRLDGGIKRTIFTENIGLEDNTQILIGSGNDLQMYHDATDSWIKNSHGNLVFRNTKQNKDIMFQGDDGQASDDTVATYFYLDGSSAAHDGSATTHLYTNWPDKSYISLGTGHDLQLVHTGVNSVIQSLVGKLQITSSSDDLEFTQFGNDKDINFSSDDGSGGTATYFRLDGGEGHMIAYKELNFADGIPATFGNTAGGDLEIKEQSGSSYIMNHTGDLKIQQFQDDGDISFQCDNGSGGNTEYIRIDGSAGYTIASKTLNWLDGVYGSWGTSGDLLIYHDGTNSYINNATGNLQIKNSADDGDIEFVCDDGAGGNTTYLTLDGSQGFTTVQKAIRFDDNVPLQVGSASDFFIQHDGTNTNVQNNTGSLTIRNDQDDGDIIFKSDDGSGGVTEYFRLDGGDSVTRFTRQARFSDNIVASFGDSGDLQLYHNGAHSLISNQTGSLFIRNQTNDGDIVFQADDGSGGDAEYFKLDGSATTTVFSKDTRHSDNVKALFGGNNDLKMYHDGSNSYISDTGTGSLYINGSTVYLRANENENAVVCNFNGSVDLYHDGSASPKLSTTSTGVDVTGSLTPSLGVTKPIASAAANVAAAVAGSIYTFSDTDGAVVTLPDSGGGGLVGQTFEFVCTATATSNSHKVIFSDTTNEKFIGRLTAIDTDTDNTQLVYVPVTANKAIVMNGTTTGITGSRFTITNVAADVWMIEGYVHHTGNTANPFANS